MFERKFVYCQLDLIFPLDSHLFAVVRIPHLLPPTPGFTHLQRVAEKKGLGLFLLTFLSGFSFSKSAINSVCQNSILMCYLLVKNILLSSTSAVFSDAVYY